MPPIALVLLAVLPVQGGPWEEGKIAEIPAGFEPVAHGVPCTNFGRQSETVTFVWSDDGRQVAYAATRAEADGEIDWFPVVGDSVGEAYGWVSRPLLAGGRVVFRVARTKTESTEEWRLWIDGEALDAEDWMGEAAIAPDGSQVAFWVLPGARVGNAAPAVASDHFLSVAVEQRRGKWSVRRGEDWKAAGIPAPVFTADGKRVFTTAWVGKGWAVLAGGRGEKEATEPYRGIESFAVSENGKALAVLATAGESPTTRDSRSLPDAGLYFKGKRVGESYTHVALPTVDARGRRVAYVAMRDGREAPVIGDEEDVAWRYDHVRALTFDPSGDRLAFVANTGGTAVEGSFAIEGGRSFVVVRPASGRDAWEEHPPASAVRHLTWDADGERLAYAAFEDGGWRIVCGARRSEAFDEIGPPRFAPDGKSLGFGARSGRELWWRVLALE